MLSRNRSSVTPSTTEATRVAYSSPTPRQLRSRNLLAHPSGSSSRVATPASSPSSRLPRHLSRSRLSHRSNSSRANSSAPLQPSQNNEQDVHDDMLSIEDADALNEVLMAMNMKDNGNLGCSYYVAAEEAFYLLEEVALAEMSIVETLLFYVRPTTVLLPSRCSNDLADYISRSAQDPNGTDHEHNTQGVHVLRYLNSSDFRYEVGKDRLASLDLEPSTQPSLLYTSAAEEEVENPAELGDEVHGSKQGRLMRLATSINLDSQITVGCAGALLSELQRRKSAQYLPNDPDAHLFFKIRTLEMFSLFNSMFINADTLISLQIIQAEHHPNSHQRGPTGASSGAKESLSVYGLFHHLANTYLGKIKLRRLFLRPSIDIEVIRERQKIIGLFLRPDNYEVLMGMTKCLKRIGNMRAVLDLLQKGVDNTGPKMSVTRNAWAVMQRFAASSLQIREHVRAIPSGENFHILRQIVETIKPYDLCHIGEIITYTIDFGQSDERGRTAVKQGVDLELDELKRRYDGMEDFLTNVVAHLRAALPEWAIEYIQNCIFYPQLGFLTAVTIDPKTGRSLYNGEGLNDVWEQMFAAEGYVYYKNRQMKEIDEQFGDAYCMITDREIEIIHGLTVEVLKNEQVIISASNTLGELDSLLALALGCGQYGWTAPQVVENNIIHIEGGRHPLQELVVPAFIANDCRMSGGCDNDENHEASEVGSVSTGPSDQTSPSTVILTGPNHSGKSVYLKQVAIIVYLAHIGCFVPAERALIGLTDRILTRIATRESVTRKESAFAIDLRQVAFAMRFATHRSLVLVDEFGKGTDSVDGASLVAALVNHFTGLGAQRPKVLAATHFHEILDGQFLKESEDLVFKHMKIRVDHDASAVEDQVIYLFQLAPGRSTSSFGSTCAAMNGVEDAVVQRAEDLMLLLANNEDLAVVCSKLTESEAQKLERAEIVARKFVQEEIPESPLAAGGRRSRSDHNDGGKYRAILEHILERTG